MTASRDRLPGSTAGTERTDIEAVLTLLSNERRRLVLLALDDRDGSVSTDELARLVAGRESDATVSVDSTSVELSLRHWHLPKLAEAGAIGHDQQRSMVELTTDSGLLSQLVHDVRVSE